MAVVVPAASAETFSGGAAVAKLQAFCEGKILKLAAPGESAEREFVLSLYSRDSDLVTQLASVGGQRLVVLRAGTDGFPAGVGGQDWSWLPSSDAPGGFLYLPGTAAYGFLDGRERSLDMVLAGVESDPAFAAPSGADFTGMLTPELAEGDVCRLETGAQEWTFFHQKKESGTLSRFRIDPVAAWPVREFSAASKEGGLQMVVQTGKEIPAEWRKVGVESLFAIGRPVRTRQASSVQWKKKAEPKFFETKECMPFLQGMMKPWMESLQFTKDGGGEGWEEFQAARKALGELVPLPAPFTMKAGAETAPKVRSTVVEGRGREWENGSHPLPEDGAPVTVPLKFAIGTPIVKVRIGKAEHWLTIDTGSRFSFLADGVIAADWQHTMRPIGSPTADLHSEDKNPELRRVPEMEIGAWKLQKAVFSIKRPGSVADTSEPVQGLIGTDILSLHPFTIDWPAGKLTLHRREGFTPPPGAVEVLLGDTSGRPSVAAKLDGAGDFQPLLDTGFSGMLLVPESFRTAHTAAFEGLRSVRDSVRAPNGAVTQRMTLWPPGRALEAAGIKAQGGFGIYEATAQQGLTEAVVGCSFLAGTRATFDLENNRLWIEKPPAQSVKERLAAGWNIEETDASGYTALGQALFTGNLPACGELAAAGASLMVGPGLSAAVPAVRSGNPAVVEWVVARDKAGAWKKSPALSLAVRMGAVETARWLLDHGISREANPDAMGYAAYLGDVATAELLHKAGYPLTFRNAAGESAPLLFAAVEGNQPAFLKWLLTVDKEALTKGSQASTLCNKTAGMTDSACLKVLLDAGMDPNAAATGGNSPLHIAASFGRHAALELLLPKMKPDLHFNNPQGTPLMQALYTGQAESVKILLAHGANPEGANGDGDPLYAAGMYLNPEGREKAGITALLARAPELKTDYEGSVRQLLAAGADPLRRRENHCPAEAIAAHSAALAKLCLEKGATPENAPLLLSIAVENDRGEIVSLLLARGWKPEQRVAGAAAPLHSAIQRGLTGVVQALLAGGVDLKKPFSDGTTPLHCAARHNDPHLISLLAKAGADLNAEDDSGLTPLATAIEWRMFAAVRGLIQAGADPRRKSDAFTPLEMATHLDPKYRAIEEFLRKVTEAKK